jgi:hypothetical protein
MTRNRYYTTVVPIAGLLYVIALLFIHVRHVSSVGAIMLAVVVLAGAFLPSPAPTHDDREHEREHDHS